MDTIIPSDFNSFLMLFNLIICIIKVNSRHVQNVGIVHYSKLEDARSRKKIIENIMKDNTKPNETG